MLNKTESESEYLSTQLQSKKGSFTCGTLYDFESFLAF